MNAYINLETCVIMFQTTCQYLKVDKELKKKYAMTSKRLRIIPNIPKKIIISRKYRNFLIFLVLFVSSMENVSLPQHLHITGTF